MIEESIGAETSDIPATKRWRELNSNCSTQTVQEKRYCVENMDAYGVGTMSSPLKNNLLFASFDFHRQMENWSSLDLRMLQRTPFNNFPSYSYLYHPYYGAFSASAYRNYLDIRHFFRSHLTMAPYATMNHRYCCYDSANRCSIFGNTDFQPLCEPLFSFSFFAEQKFNFDLFKLAFVSQIRTCPNILTGHRWNCHCSESLYRFAFQESNACRSFEHQTIIFRRFD